MSGLHRASYPEPLEILLRELRRLPGVGPKSAERMGLWLVTSADARPGELAAALAQMKSAVRACRCCGFFSMEEVCPLCLDPNRAGRELCVVERATDILPIERTSLYHGRYHALGGRLSPLEQISPEDLRIGELLERIRLEEPAEIILALSADVEGEATTAYLSQELAALGVPVTRIAHGLPAGGGLEHADPLTLLRAFSGRKPL